MVCQKEEPMRSGLAVTIWPKLLGRRFETRTGRFVGAVVNVVDDSLEGLVRIQLGLQDDEVRSLMRNMFRDRELWTKNRQPRRTTNDYRQTPDLGPSPIPAPYEALLENQ